MRETEHYTTFETSLILTSRITTSIILYICQRFIVKCISHRLGETFRFAVFRLMENAFVKLSLHFWHDLIIISPMQNNPSYICPKKFVLHEKLFQKKVPSIL